MIFQVFYKLNAWSAQGSLFKAGNTWGQNPTGAGSIPPPPLGDFVEDNVNGFGISLNTNNLFTRLNLP